MVGHGGRSADSYLADPTFPSASIVLTSTVRVSYPKLKQPYYKELHYLHMQHVIRLGSPVTTIPSQAHYTQLHVMTSYPKFNQKYQTTNTQKKYFHTVYNVVHQIMCMALI